MAYERMSLGGAAARGALAGVAGGLVLNAVWRAGQQFIPPAHRVESPTGEVVEKMAEEHAMQISSAEVKTLAGLGYTGSMAVWGAVYGMVQSRVHPPMLVHGLLLGGLVYAANFLEGGALPKQGIIPPPSEQSVGEAAFPMVAHAVFGLATAAVFEALA